MKKNKLLLLVFVVLLSANAIAQPFADIVSFNYQTFSAKYKDSVRSKNHTDNYAFSLFFPKEFKNGNMLLVRINSELLNSTIMPDTSYSRQLASVSVPLGFQFVSKSKKWKTVTIVIPKLASDFRDNAMNSNNYQLGGIFLENYLPNDKLKIKAGLYYNREAFGNFFMPLVGLDWKINKRISLYGVLPTNYKVEFNLLKNRLYSGVCFKSLTRSFRLSKGNNYDYVRYDEEQLKVFVDYFVVPKLLLFAEAGYTLGKSPIQYMYNTNEKVYYNPVYTPTQSYPIFNVGIAFRIRQDLEKSEEIK